MKRKSLECPKCGKHTIIQRNHDLFQCLNCDFMRDFSHIPEPIYSPPPTPNFEIDYKSTTSKPQSDDAWDAVAAVIIFVILALFLGL